MNNPSKIDVKLSVDAKLPGDGLGAHAHGHANIVCSPHPRSDAVSDSNLSFNGDFGRSGVDLIVSKDDHEPVLQDYFRSEKRAALSSPDGAHLTGNIVNALTGHVEYAQAGGAPDAAKVIGHIQTAIGSGTLTRAGGIAVQAKVGDPVCQGDVIETAADGRVGRYDGAGFELSGSARVVLDEFVATATGPRCFASSTAPASTCPAARAWCWTNSSATPTGPRIRPCSVSPEGPSLSLSARWLRPVASGSTRLLEAFRAALVPAGSACCRSLR